MTVAELIDALRALPQDAPVYVPYDMSIHGYSTPATVTAGLYDKWTGLPAGRVVIE